MSRKRRGRDEGSLYQRADGLWAASVSAGYDAHGRRKRRTVYGDSKAEVQAKLQTLQADASKGVLGDADRMTLAAYLHSWLETTARLTCAFSTYDRYKRVVNRQLLPHLGGVKVAKLAPVHIHTLLAQLEKAGESAWARKMAVKVLGIALRRARRLRLIVRDPCEDVPLPRPEAHELQTFTEEQVRTFLKASEGRRYHALFAVALGAGLRRGELLGLQWPDIDFDKETLTVRRTLIQVSRQYLLKEPKSRNGRRTLRLPRFVLDALRDHQKRMLAEGNIAAAVFCTRTGKFLHNGTLHRDIFKPILKKAKLPDVRFHDLRHTHASILLARGESIKAISRRLGHSSIKLTLEVYCHLLPDADDQLADSFEGVVSGSGSAPQQASAANGYN